MDLRDYQLDLKGDINAAWAQGHKNVIGVLPTGGGKTVVFSSEIADHKGCACAIAHRQELVSQISIALAREGIKHNIIGPIKVFKSISAQHLIEFGVSFLDPNAQVAVAGVDTLRARAASGALDHWLKQVTLVVMDECFVAGTLIDGRPIESIKAGDFVTAFNEVTGLFEQRRVERLFKNPAPLELVRLKIGHHVLECTKGHPLWTKRGWINAGDITKNDTVYMVQQGDHSNKRGATVSMAKNRAYFLRQKLWTCSSRKSPSKNKQTSRAHIMQHVRCDHGIDQRTPEENRATLLRQKMLKRIQSNKVISYHGRNQSKTCIRTNEEKQPHAGQSYAGQSVSNAQAHQPSAKNKRRQRSPRYARRTRTHATVRSSGVCRTTHRDNRFEGCDYGMSQTLQDRLRSQESENSNRSRWAESRCPQTTGSGPAQEYVSHWARVDSVEIFKRSDLERDNDSTFDGYVYNIEVEGLHTYVANGVTVHNCHHVLKDNKWGKAVAMFPNARMLGVTATPLRADGKGLGEHSDGYFTAMVEGPSMRELIDRGFLTDYRIFAAPSDIDLTDVGTDATGDFNKIKLKVAVERSHIVGDVVKHYLKIAPGKLGITFASDVETASVIAAQFNAAGVPAMVLSAKTPDHIRSEVKRRLARREVLQLVNVDLFGEGFDLPAIEVVSFARPTQSYGLYCQQFGRVLRILEGKTEAIIIDHVGNVGRHGLPDAVRAWTLDRRPKRKKLSGEDVIPVTTCPACTAVYEITHHFCPYCDHVKTPANRSSPKFVDGDLTELDPAVLANMRGEVDRIDGPARIPQGLNGLAAAGAMAQHHKRQVAQAALRNSLVWWGGYYRGNGDDNRCIYKRFYSRFGIDMMTAQSLGRPDAEELTKRVNTHIGEIVS